MTITKETEHGTIIVDECDADLLDMARSRKSAHKYYALNYIAEKQRAIFTHRIILERALGRALLDTEQADHINGFTLDNRRCNLRIATPSQNGANRRINKNSTSGFKGVTWHAKSRKWRASIKVGQTSIHIGLYQDPTEAHRAYMDAARRYFGEFANDGSK